MSTVPAGKSYVAYVVMVIALFVAWPLWREFHEVGLSIWNAFLAAFLLALVIGSFFGVRYLQNRRIEVGEARFTSVDRSAE